MAGSAQKELEPGGVPDIAVAPLSISFGAIDPMGGDDAAGSASAVQSVVIANVGEGDLHIRDIALADADAPFVLGAVSPLLIQPGGEASFSVTFEPLTATNYASVVVIASNDPDEGVVEVALTGSGSAPVISVAPVSHDFGALYIGCGGEQPIQISNIGNAPLEVTGFEYNTGSSDLWFEDAAATNGPLPWTLMPGESHEVMVGYAPFDEFADSAYLFVASDDPHTPRIVAAQDGTGALYGTNRDLYEQPIQGQTDVILGVDRSCSMDDDIENIQANFGVFVGTMATLDVDFHVSATVEDTGCINGPDVYIDNTFSASDAQSAITTMINLGGSYASNTERGFMLFEACLAESIDPSGCNWGLVREGARLNLIGVSDEPEQSVSDYSQYVSAFQTLKADPNDVVIHAIGGDYPGGCGSALPYTGFYEATVATGGLFLSICATDWPSHLEALAVASTRDLSSFELTDTPVPSTIAVRVDGLSATVGWSYDASTNRVEFESDHVPEGGATVEFEYALYGDCDL